MDNDVQEKIAQIQLLQQNLHNFSSQRQQFQMQQTEIETALKELERTKVSYKIIGNIMVSYEREELKGELSEKKQMIDIRISSIEKQETNLKDRAEKIQKEIMEKLEHKNKNDDSKK